MAGNATKKKLANKKRERELKSLARLARRIEKCGDLESQHTLLEGLDDGWENIRQRIVTLAGEGGNWAGYPMPMVDVSLEIEPRHPLYATLNGASLSKKDDPVDHDNCEIVNQWIDRERGRQIIVYREDGQVKCMAIPNRTSSQRASIVLDTLCASQAWSVRAEFTALASLKGLVTSRAFRYYLLTGTFLETSKRSKIIYFFRKCRPTLAIAPMLGHDNTKILAALCMHPIGFYRGTYAGSMVPTDDVIAHLLLMRADERKFWAKCNQHDPRAPEAGV